MGYQVYLMVNNLVGFWAVGTTSAGWLALKAGFGVHGLWIGTILGVLTSALLNLLALLRVDWQVRSPAPRYACTHFLPCYLPRRARR